MTEINLTGITKVQRELIIWAYQRGGVFTWDEAKAAHFNIRTKGAVEYKRILWANYSTDKYYLNPDYCREIRAKLESWGVQMRDYSADFGAWFDAHLGVTSAPPNPPIEEPPIDPEDTPILPMRPVEYLSEEPTPRRCPECRGSGYSDPPAESNNFTGKTCDYCDGRAYLDDDDTAPPDDWFSYDDWEKEQDKRAEYEFNYWNYGSGGGDPFGWMQHFRPDRAKVRADYQAGYLLIRKLVGKWEKGAVIRFVCKFLSPSDAFIAGMNSYVYANYRDNERKTDLSTVDQIPF